jgi:gluconate 2-dehydrogenase gamma chain
MPGEKLNRRAFMEICSAGIGTTILIAHCSEDGTNLWRFFTGDEAYLIGLIAEQIIPADDFPGAIEAGVVHFIDRQLALSYKRFQADYRNGLQHFQATSVTLFGEKFEKLIWQDQTNLLKTLEAGTAPQNHWTDISDRQFFRLIRSHTMQGYYGSPRHGGNKQYISYRMMGLDYPQIVGQNRYR